MKDYNYLKFYILKDKEPTPVKEFRDYFTWIQENPEGDRIALDNVLNCLISTVFVHIDLEPSPFSPPVHFETQIFGGEFDGKIKRYTTYNDAEKGHAAMVEKVKSLFN